MKSPRSPFLEAPREIRDLIYEFYVATDDGLGFVYNFETGKVRPRSGLPIDLSLMYTCRTVATEMQGVALGQNTITFTTFYSEELSSRVAEYDSFYQEVCQLQVGSLACAETSVIATNARDEVTRDFSWFGAAYDAAMRIQPTQDIYHRDPYDIARYRAKLLLVKTGGPAPLLHFQAVLRALTLASATGQQFVDEVGNKPFRMERDALWDRPAVLGGDFIAGVGSDVQLVFGEALPLFPQDPRFDVRSS
ncbi:hypothetical protein F5X68DRAFT_265205 [Plectosphaerella plurivora]|uniref:Uncharacterized protein n=1 Tax=Plectosphaerella plurivora TaxID=936078 RepID=A0A9P9A609_9PEZI|nr:hypothetical protein F5X68DRAFT_265205 [Plectosphaerella plurivora]